MEGPKALGELQSASVPTVGLGRVHTPLWKIVEILHAHPYIFVFLASFWSCSFLLSSCALMPPNFQPFCEHSFINRERCSLLIYVSFLLKFDIFTEIMTFICL